MYTSLTAKRNGGDNGPSGNRRSSTRRIAAFDADSRRTNIVEMHRPQFGDGLSVPVDGSEAPLLWGAAFCRW